jgi:diguanylate cyclase (GGDEF)-like protein
MTLAVCMTALVVVVLREPADRLYAKLRQQAMADSLTGLANRRLFDDELGRGVAWAHQNGGDLALITVDVDYFKRINDTWGHTVGDIALQEVAAAMRRVAGAPDDVAARLGGDEFVMLVRRDRAGAVLAAEELRHVVSTISVLPGGAPGLSIGVAMLPGDATTVEGLLSASDRALYDAKTRGRGQVATYDVPQGEQNLDRLRYPAVVVASSS